jgi:hypothetical protein
MKNLEILPIPIPKKDLIIGKKYSGICSNTSEAVWNGKVFEYERYKFGFFYDDTINHYEDDDGYDVFVPFERC